MTVDELIVELKKYPGNFIVQSPKAGYQNGYYVDSIEVSEVEGYVYIEGEE